MVIFKVKFEATTQNVARSFWCVELATLNLMQSVWKIVLEFLQQHELRKRAQKELSQKTTMMTVSLSFISLDFSNVYTMFCVPESTHYSARCCQTIRNQWLNSKQKKFHSSKHNTNTDITTSRFLFLRRFWPWPFTQLKQKDETCTRFHRINIGCTHTIRLQYTLSLSLAKLPNIQPTGQFHLSLYFVIPKCFIVVL